MKTTITFQLPEERDEHHLALHGIDYYLSLLDLSNYLRTECKYHTDKYTASEIELIYSIGDRLRLIMEDRGVHLDDVS